MRAFGPCHLRSCAVRAAHGQRAAAAGPTLCQRRASLTGVPGPHHRTPSHTIGWSHSCSPWLTAQAGHAPEAPLRIQHMVAGILRSARRIVVKVGSSLVTNEGRGLDEAAIGEWSRQLAALVRGDAGAAREVVMVSSGAIAEGMK